MSYFANAGKSNTAARRIKYIFKHLTHMNQSVKVGGKSETAQRMTVTSVMTSGKSRCCELFRQLN